MSIQRLDPAPAGATLYVTDGQFAEAVVSACQRPGDQVISSNAKIEEGWLREFDVVVAIGCSHHKNLLEALDRICFRIGIPHLMLDLAPTKLRCGPMFRPGTGPCYQCYQKRIKQHHNLEPVTEEVRPSEGFAPFHVSLAQGLMQLSLAEIANATAPTQRGSVLVVDLVTGSPSRATVLPTNGCDRCSEPISSIQDYESAWLNFINGRY